MNQPNTLANKIWRRFFEMLPGSLSWSILLYVLILAVINPVSATIFVICFYLFWLLRLLYMTILLVGSYMILDRERGTDWLLRCQDFREPEKSIGCVEKRISDLQREARTPNAKQIETEFTSAIWSEKSHLRKLKWLSRQSFQIPDFNSIYHVVIFPNYQEEIQILTSALDALAHINYPLDRLMVVMAFEEREGENAKKRAEFILSKFKNVFGHLMCTFHPANLPGELAVKGANATWAAKKASEVIQEKGIPFENILVSCFDADTCVRKEYFGCLTYNFMLRPDRLNCSFQPIPVYHNNVWEAPAFARMFETSSSYWQLIESANPDHLVTFSSHSMSFKALIEANFWPVDMISDDSAIFWRCFLHYKGKYRATPIFVTLSMNILVGKNWWDTFKKIYVQKRRWAWGIENFPMVMMGFLHDREIPFSEKIRHGFKMLESHVSWATWGLMLTFFGWLPLILVRLNPQYEYSVVSFHLPQITKIIFNLAGFSLLVSIGLSFLITPKPPAHISKWRNFQFAFQWFLPILLPALLALPALDAQTRLLLARPLTFQVTKKT